MRILVCWLALLQSAHSEPLADRPAAGLDGDVTMALNRAAALAAAGQAAEASNVIIQLQLSPDRFTARQRPAFATQSARILRAGALQLASRDPEAAAQSADLAWSVSGRFEDPEAAELLSQYAERIRPDDPQGAHYVARRALLMDPHNAAALQIDDELNRNRRKGAGLTLVVLGALFGIGPTVVALPPLGFSDGSQTLIIGAGVVAGAALLAGGMILLKKGAPSRFPPTSPAHFPLRD